MTRRILYEPPDGEGPTILATCVGCRYVEVNNVGIMFCANRKTYGYALHSYPLETPSWCPIVSADMETWERWLKGHDA